MSSTFDRRVRWSLAGEALRIARSQPVTSLLTFIMVAVACVTILLTTGRTVAAETAVLARVDDVGTRSVTVTDTQGRAHIHPESVDRIARLSGVEWVLGLGYATDAHNQHIPAATPVPLRTYTGTLPPPITIHTTPGDTPPGPGHAIVGTHAQPTLGLPVPAGGITTPTTAYAIVGTFTALDPLDGLNTSILTPATNPTEPLRSIHVLVNDPARIATVGTAVRATVTVDDPTQLTIETSQTLADIRAAVAGELGRFGRDLLAVILATSALLTTITVYASVTTRRRDLGRRRALGASRPDLIALIITHTAIVATPGALAGTGLGITILHHWTNTTPHPTFTIAVTLATLTAALTGTIPPALHAATRDPVTILRVP